MAETQDRQSLVGPSIPKVPVRQGPRRLRFPFFYQLVKEQPRRPPLPPALAGPAPETTRPFRLSPAGSTKLDEGVMPDEGGEASCAPRQGPT
jgi:hypothetical protein